MPRTYLESPLREYKINKMQDILGLNNNEFMKFKTDIRKLMKNTLEVDRVLSDQGDALDRMRTKVSLKYPDLLQKNKEEKEAYIYTYTTKCFNTWRHTFKTKIAIAPPTHPHPPPLPPSHLPPTPLPSSYPKRASAEPQIASISKKILPSPPSTPVLSIAPTAQPRQKFPPTPAPPPPTTVPLARPPISPFATTVPASARAPPPPTPPATEKTNVSLMYSGSESAETEGVQFFLNQCHPPMTHFLPNLLALGCKNLEYLRGLSRWAPEHIDELLWQVSQSSMTVMDVLVLRRGIYHFFERFD